MSTPRSPGDPDRPEEQTPASEQPTWPQPPAVSQPFPAPPFEQRSEQAMSGGQFSMMETLPGGQRPSGGMASMPLPPMADLGPGAQPGFASGNVAVMPPPAPPRDSFLNKFARPWPSGASLGSIALIIVILIGVQVSAGNLGFYRAQVIDWASGTKLVGISAGISAGIVLLILLVRLFGGLAARTNPRRQRQIISSAALLLVLIALCGAGLGLGSPIHRLQAGSLESQQQWGAALQEYQLAGEHAPASNDLARVYVKWGEQLSAAQNYGPAIDRFNVVLTSYPGAAAEVQQAQKDEINALLAWGKQDSDQNHFAAATSHYDTLLSQPYCTADCQAQGSALDATAYYNLAETSLAANDYAAAINAFHTLLARFANSPEAGKVHPDVAKALLAQGQQLRSGSACSSALSTYQELVQNYADTPEGQQASKDLRAPEPVIGTIQGAFPYLPGGTAFVALVKGWHLGMSPEQELDLAINARYKTHVHPDSTFRFAAVAQGTYGLVYGSEAPDAILATYIYNSATGKLIYIATVGPLCPFDFGIVNIGTP